MLGTFPGESIKKNIPGTIDLEAVRTKLNQMFSETFSLGSNLKLEIDGDHRISAFSDGLSIMHYIHQQQHQSMSPWAPPSFIQAGRPANEIQQHLKDLVGF